jgi:hypothetical protein
MTEDTQNNIWSALFIVVIMALGALLWGVLKRVKMMVSKAIKNVREKSDAKPAPAK